MAAPKGTNILERCCCVSGLMEENKNGATKASGRWLLLSSWGTYLRRGDINHCAKFMLLLLEGEGEREWAISDSLHLCSSLLAFFPPPLLLFLSRCTGLSLLTHTRKYHSSLLSSRKKRLCDSDCSRNCRVTNYRFGDSTLEDLIIIEADLPKSFRKEPGVARDVW